MQEVFTTGQVAKICYVATRTVSKWIDSDRLRGYRIPGSRTRRISRGALREFMLEHDIPLDGLEGDVPRLLLVDCSEEIVDAIRDHVPTTYKFSVTNDTFVTGMLLASRPHCIVTGNLAFASRVRGLPSFETLPIIVLVDDQANIDQALFTDVFRKPFDACLLAARIQHHAERYIAMQRRHH